MWPPSRAFVMATLLAAQAISVAVMLRHPASYSPYLWALHAVLIVCLVVTYSYFRRVDR